MLIQSDHWKGRGVSVLFDARTIGELAGPHEVWPIDRWVRTDDVGAISLSRVIAVAGLETHLDQLSPDACDDWVTTALIPAVTRFRRTHRDRVGLVFWVPDGRRRLRIDPTTNACDWFVGKGRRLMSLSRTLFGDDRTAVACIVDPRTPPVNLGADDPAWIGLHLMRAD